MNYENKLKEVQQFRKTIELLPNTPDQAIELCRLLESLLREKVYEV